MSGLIPPATLEQIRLASDIVEIIGSYVPLKRAGANFVALCPFHKEKSPSFNVNPHKQIFHCFGCHKGGDVFTFVKDYENIGFMDAVRRLAERAHIVLEFENQPGQQQARHLKDTLLQIHEQITQRWQAALANDAAGQIARDYLQKRGVSDEAIKLFRLGYAPDLWDDTVNWAKSKNFELPDVEQAGLILKKENGGFYDRFRGRLMFPICDEQGRVIGFSGRILSGDEKTAKYVNSPETPIFKKGKVLFALDKAKRSILDAGCVVVCEGQLDTMSCHANGVTHVVAPQGTALTSDHVRILQRYTNDIILCFDGDNAGRKAAARGFDDLITLKIPFRVAEIPSPEDPDSFLKKFGREAFFNLLVKSRDFFEWYLDYLSQLHDPTSDRGRLAIIRGMAEVLNHPQNMVLTDTYIQKTSLRLGVSAAAVRTEIKKLPRAPAAAEEVEPEEASQTEDRPSQQEFWLLKLILQNDDHMEWVLHHLDLNWLVHSTIRELIASRLQAHAEENWRGVAGWLGEIENESGRMLITEALTDDRENPDAEKILKGDANKLGLVKILRDKFIDRQLAAISQRLADPQLPDAEAIEFSWQKLQLRQLKQKPLSPLAEDF
jgi:DNA primase